MINMIKRLYIIFVFSLIHLYAFGNDNYKDFIVIESIKQSDFEGGISIISRLSERADKNYSSVMEHIYYSRENNPAERELLLYYCLNYLITDSNSADANKDILDLICSGIMNYNDSLLRKEIIKKLDYIDNASAVKILIKESRLLADKADNNSSLEYHLLKEAELFIRQAGKYDSLALKESVLSLYREIRNLPAEYIK